VPGKIEPGRSDCVTRASPGLRAAFARCSIGLKSTRAIPTPRLPRPRRLQPDRRDRRNATGGRQPSCVASAMAATSASFVIRPLEEHSSVGRDKEIRGVVPHAVASRGRSRRPSIRRAPTAAPGWRTRRAPRRTRGRAHTRSPSMFSPRPKPSTSLSHATCATRSMTGR
jgi:hypothetical protein